MFKLSVTLIKSQDKLNIRKICIRIPLFICVILLFSVFTFPVSAENGDTIVYITDSGSKYHSYGCQYLSRSQDSITLEEAFELGYSPCSKCNPPIYDSNSETTSIVRENNLNKTSSEAEITSTTESSRENSEHPETILQPTHIVIAFLVASVIARISYLLGKRYNPNIVEYNRLSHELNDLNHAFQNRFGHLCNPITKKPITDAKTYLEALDAQDRLSNK